MGVLHDMRDIISFPKAAPNPVSEKVSGENSMSQGLGHPPSMIGIATMSDAGSAGSAVDTRYYVGGGGGGSGVGNGFGGGSGVGNGFGGGSYGAAVMGRTNVTIDTVENGFLVTMENKAFICETAEDVAKRILAQMVTNKMEK